jgi:hypothetical protein
MSDWDAVYSQVTPIKAGCNLEIPGPSIHREFKLPENVKSGRISTGEESPRYFLATFVLHGSIRKKHIRISNIDMKFPFP